MQKYVQAAERPLHSVSPPTPEIIFHNEAALLLVTSASVSKVDEQLHGRSPETTTQLPDPVLSTPYVRNGTLSAVHFRPNLVLASAHVAPFAEDTWHHVTMGGVELRVMKKCDRCAMLFTNQVTGAKYGPGVYRELVVGMRERGGGDEGGKPTFGVLLKPIVGRMRVVEVGMRVLIDGEVQGGS